MNTVKCFSTPEQKKETQQAIGKAWRENNKDRCLVRDKEYRDKNKEKIAEYYENNKEQILEKRRKYYQMNKEKILEKEKEKITCECGCIVNKYALTRHKKTQKHIKIMEEMVQIIV